MNKKFIIISIVSVFVLILAVYLLFFRNSSEPKVLGLSVNNFYVNKNIEIEKAPVRKPNAIDPNVLADVVMLIDDRSKYPLFYKNEMEPVPIASITKVMTFVVARENYNLTDVLEVGSEPVKVIGSKINLEKSEKITIRSLFYGLLMNSGNDAAVALSYFKGDQKEFVEKMNEKALELGMNNTHFVDPAGLDDSGRSCAFDVAVMFSYALKDDLFREIIGTSESEISSVDGQITHPLKNSNRLVTGEIELGGILGGKTGFTLDAGHTLVSAAERDGNKLISVILKTQVNSKTASAYESQKLLSWGFDSFTFN